VKLLLGFLLATVVLGIMTDKLDVRIYLFIIGGAVFMTGLFFTFQRFWL
jgi:hypothetical protein